MNKELYEAMVIFAASDWTVLLVGYSRTFYNIDRWGMRYGIEK